MLNLKPKNLSNKRLQFEIAACLVVFGVSALLSVSSASAKGGTASLPSASGSSSGSGKGGGIDSVPSISISTSTSSPSTAPITVPISAPASTSSASSSGKNGSGSLASLPRLEPSNLSNFIANKQEAIALGKALFWEMRAGGNGVQACASCHFHAGADTRSKNQLHPDSNNVFAFGGPNYQLKTSDYPFVQFADMSNQNSQLVHDNHIVAGSQGVFNETFLAVTPNQAHDITQINADTLYDVNGVNTRQTTGRNTPAVINAVFNLRNFWDGRAQTIFNGADPFGKRDAGAKVYRSALPSSPQSVLNVANATAITLDNSALASQVSGPPNNHVEMSADGRSFPDLGHKMLSMRALEGQAVAADDGVLGAYRAGDGNGLIRTYEDMARSAFKPDWWNASTAVTINGKSYSQLEANFSLVFPLAVQLYEATLVSDKAPFDKYAEGNRNALTKEQQKGMDIFNGKGHCSNCHTGPAFSSAAMQLNNNPNERLVREFMGNDQLAVHDKGFYNIGVTRTQDDLGIGGTDPFGKPLSFSRLAQSLGSAGFASLEQQAPNLNVSPNERVAVDGTFKVPSLRNVSLTAPYFHNGSAATLMQVVEFYNRGGNFAANNIDNLAPDIKPLHLSQSDKKALVAFLESLTDPRVAKHAAPFDHPQLYVPNGEVGDDTSVTMDGYRNGMDDLLEIPASGGGGYSSNAVSSFLGL